MVDLGMYIFKDLNTGKTTIKESFTNANVKELYESGHAHNSTKQLCAILDAKYGRGRST